MNGSKKQDKLFEPIVMQHSSLLDIIISYEKKWSFVNMDPGVLLLYFIVYNAHASIAHT
jgi:hypothetical protein